MGKRKGQMIFEFLVASVIFFAVIFYLINYLGVAVNTFSGNFYSDNLQNKALQISEFLVRFNLSEGGWPVLSSARMNSFRNDYGCSAPDPCKAAGYGDLLLALDLDEKSGMIEGLNYNVNITINDTSTGNFVLDCGCSVPENVGTGEVRRFALDESGDILILDVRIW